jgi:hypothetical protein
MIWHPLLLAIVSVDVMSGLLLLSTAMSAFQIALRWNPISTDRTQIALEGRAESASIRGRWLLTLLLFSCFLMIVGISNVFHGVIPGAMCGTGVLQALGDGGRRMLLYRVFLIIAILFWFELDKLNRIDRGYPLTALNARVFFAATPLAALALVESARAFVAVNVHQPVDCCAVVYDQFKSLTAARSAAGISDKSWLIAFTFLSILLTGLTIVVRFSSTARPWRRVGLTLTTLLWLPVASVTLVNILAAYHYGVLHHHCPWCLFLAEYNFVGYPLFGALAVVTVEGLLVSFLPFSVKQEKQLLSVALRRSRRACTLMLAGLAVFMVLACLPPLIWRLRYGVWIGG